MTNVTLKYFNFKMHDSIKKYCSFISDKSPWIKAFLNSEFSGDVRLLL